MQTRDKAKGSKGAAAVYIRISREFGEKDGVSLDQQQAFGVALAEREGYTVHPDHIFVDRNLGGYLWPKQWASNENATKKFRPGFTALVAAVEAGEVKALVIRKANRLVRGLELSRKMWKFFDKHKLEVFATGEGLSRGKDSSSRLATDVMALVSEFQYRQTSEDQRDGKKYAVAATQSGTILHGKWGDTLCGRRMVMSPASTSHCSTAWRHAAPWA